MFAIRRARQRQVDRTQPVRHQILIPCAGHHGPDICEEEPRPSRTNASSSKRPSVSGRTRALFDRYQPAQVWKCSMWPKLMRPAPDRPSHRRPTVPARPMANPSPSADHRRRQQAAFSAGSISQASHRRGVAGVSRIRGPERGRDDRARIGYTPRADVRCGEGGDGTPRFALRSSVGTSFADGRRQRRAVDRCGFGVVDRFVREAQDSYSRSRG